jgi:hypothetical protein
MIKGIWIRLVDSDGEIYGERFVPGGHTVEGSRSVSEELIKLIQFEWVFIAGERIEFEEGESEV